MEVYMGYFFLHFANHLFDSRSLVLFLFFLFFSSGFALSLFRQAIKFRLSLQRCQDKIVHVQRVCLQQLKKLVACIFKNDNIPSSHNHYFYSLSFCSSE
ncbi:hypothetical protein EDC96DRAFT_506750 [Choanephora cucurbitarum]|nr:hypothetical protein EDC96DRAFT_506750 [Choanephora cucurbitarum]